MDKSATTKVIKLKKSDVIEEHKGGARGGGDPEGVANVIKSLN